MGKSIQIVEVGPRDGLQNEPVILETALKLEFIDRLVAAGVRRMEAASFVNPKRTPAMADAEPVMASADRSKCAFIGLALNERGVRRAIAARCDEINVVLVASEGFGRANQNATPDQSAELFERVAVLAKDAQTPLSATIAVAFGDPFDGAVAPQRVARLAARAQAAGAVEIALADTIGVATPWDVSALCSAVRREAADARLRVHFHNTRNTAIANVYAAVNEGVDVIDASCGGIGGCPFAPNATGNVATEDVVYLLEKAGYETGIDLAGVIDTARWLERSALRHPVNSALAHVGV